MFALYLGCDIIFCLGSVLAIKQVKKRKAALKAKPKFKIFHHELEMKLKEVQYLPIAYESDAPDDEDDI